MFTQLKEIIKRVQQNEETDKSIVVGVYYRLISGAKILTKVGKAHIQINRSLSMEK
jgi:hypothetical protein